MWIVRLALRLPYTFVVLAILVSLLGTVTIARMPTDIFPEIDIPVVAVVWLYGGVPADEMEGRIVSGFERVLVSLVNDIEHIESQSLNGTAVVKISSSPGRRSRPPPRRYRPPPRPCCAACRRAPSRR